MSWTVPSHLEEQTVFYETVNSNIDISHRYENDEATAAQNPFHHFGAPNISSIETNFCSEASHSSQSSPARNPIFTPLSQCRKTKIEDSSDQDHGIPNINLLGSEGDEDFPFPTLVSDTSSKSFRLPKEHRCDANASCNGTANMKPKQARKTKWHSRWRPNGSSGGKFERKGLGRLTIQAEILRHQLRLLRAAWDDLCIERNMLQRQQASVLEEKSQLRAAWRTLHQTREWTSYSSEEFDISDSGGLRSPSVYESDDDDCVRMSASSLPYSNEDDIHVKHQSCPNLNTSNSKPEEVSMDTSLHHLSAYNFAWDSMNHPDCISFKSLPWPTVDLSSYQLLKRPPKFVPIFNENDNAHTFILYNTIDFFASAYGMVPSLSFNPASSSYSNGQLIITNEGSVASATLEELMTQMKMERSRWHEDKLRRNGFGEVLDGKDGEIIKGVWAGVQELKKWVEEEITQRQRQKRRV